MIHITCTGMQYVCMRMRVCMCGCVCVCSPLCSHESHVPSNSPHNHVAHNHVGIQAKKSLQCTAAILLRFNDHQPCMIMTDTCTCTCMRALMANLH